MSMILFSDCYFECVVLPSTAINDMIFIHYCIRLVYIMTNIPLKILEIISIYYSTSNTRKGNYFGTRVGYCRMKILKKVIVKMLTRLSICRHKFVRTTNSIVRSTDSIIRSTDSIV